MERIPSAIPDKRSEGHRHAGAVLQRGRLVLRHRLSDDMHFEVAEETIRKWAQDGDLDT